MSTPTIQSKAAKHLPFEIAAKLRAVSADRLISAFGHRRASFTSKPSWPLIRQIILSIPRSAP